MGLAAGQKKLAQFDGKTRVGFDFAVAEQCGQWRECGDEMSSSGTQVIAVKYRRVAFRRTCTNHGAQLPVVLRDTALSPTGIRKFC